MNPKKRRLHLIEAHSFPKEYFFAVTNKGVGGLLKKWGEGASMVRGAWKPRGEQQDDDDSENELLHEDGDSEDADEEMLSGVTVRATAPKMFSVPAEGSQDGKASLDALVESMDTLSLVPRTVRFGRGAKNTRPARGSHRGGGRGARYVCGDFSRRF